MRARLGFTTVAVSIAAAAFAGNVGDTVGDMAATDGAEVVAQQRAGATGDTCAAQDVHVLDVPVRAVNDVCRIKGHVTDGLTEIVG
ncbi:hypothetical protein [Streptomyces sp. CA-132043]|uniref:hypothetical protein n=1 Tax=Streptomyces sp. CA-132043 TaxID=3240048 RepID=UPI003D924B39